MNSNMSIKTCRESFKIVCLFPYSETLHANIKNNFVTFVKNYSNSHLQKISLFEFLRKFPNLYTKVYARALVTFIQNCTLSQTPVPKSLI